MAFDFFKNAFYGSFRFGEATMPHDRSEGHTGDPVRQKSDPQARNPILSSICGVGSNIPAPFSLRIVFDVV